MTIRIHHKSPNRLEHNNPRQARNSRRGITSTPIYKQGSLGESQPQHSQTSKEASEMHNFNTHIQAGKPRRGLISITPDKRSAVWGQAVLTIPSVPEGRDLKKAQQMHNLNTHIQARKPRRVTTSTPIYKQGSLGESQPQHPYTSKEASERLNLNNPRPTQCSLGSSRPHHSLRPGGTRPQESPADAQPQHPYTSREASERLNLNNPRQTQCSLGSSRPHHSQRPGGTRPQHLGPLRRIYTYIQ